MRDEIIMTIMQYKEELIAVAGNIRLRHIQFLKKKIKLISHMKVG